MTNYPCSECQYVSLNVTGVAEHMKLHLKELKTTIGKLEDAPAQSTRTQPAEDSFELHLDKQLRIKSKIQALKMMDAPAEQAASPVSRLQEMAVMMKAFKDMFPQRDVLEVVKELQALDEIRSGLIGDADDSEPDDVQDVIAKEVISLLKNRVGGGVQQPIITPTTSPISTAAPPPIINTTSTEVRQVEQVDLDKAAERIPEFIKEGIRNGDISLETAKESAMVEIRKRGLDVTEQDIEKIYNKIKGEEDAAKKTDN